MACLLYTCSYTAPANISFEHLLSLQLDVDLSQAPSAGSVQLELWCGRALLASAPLLLLPSVSDRSSAGSDPLLAELQTSVGQLGWGEGAQGHVREAGRGASALLADLGQVLYSVECVRRAACGAGPPQVDGLNSSSGPASWGGIVPGLAAQHASSSDALSSVVYICEGLLEYAQEQGLLSTADLLSGCASRLQQRLQQVRGAGPSMAAAPPAEAAITAVAANPWLAAVARAVRMPCGSADRSMSARAQSAGDLRPPVATTLWTHNTSVFAVYHALCGLLALCTAIRADCQRWVSSSIFSVHMVAWFCCQEGRSPEHARRVQTVASICGVLSWALRTLVSQGLGTYTWLLHVMGVRGMGGGGGSLCVDWQAGVDSCTALFTTRVGNGLINCCVGHTDPVCL
jgi:hypothetical protein